MPVKYPKPFNPLMFKPYRELKNADPRAINQATYLDYFNRLEELALNMFEWKNIPPSVDPRYLELTLHELGFAVYFHDEYLGDLALSAMIGPRLNVYRIPIERRAYSVNGYQKQLTSSDSVLIFNNYLHTPTVRTIMLFAMRLANIERVIDVNTNAQRTPVLLQCPEQQLMSMKNLYAQYEGNAPVIFGAQNFELGQVTVLKTDAPYIAGELNMLKRQIWAEALTFCGIETSVSEKKERLITDEVMSNLGGVQAQRFVMLNSRREAAEQINRMFDTNIEVNFRVDTSGVLSVMADLKGSGDNGKLHDND